MRTTGTATVLFTDLVGSTELRARLGADDADELRRTHDGLLSEALTAHKGQLVKGLGDGIMATFGSAVDGVDAAIAIQQAFHRHNRSPLNEPLQVRVGLSIGDVVWEEGDCFGDPVIEASRLCAAAAGGQIIAADVVRALARQRGQSFRPIGELELKGIAAAVPATEVLWEPLADQTSHIAMPDLLEGGSRLRFAGREGELETLVAAWKSALTEGRQAVLLSGEPGIGKTRLAREIALLAHEQGATVLYGRCEEDLGAPYQPFVEALDYFVNGSPTDDLADNLGRYGGELARLSPVLPSLVPALEPPLRSDAETERYRLFEAVASWLAEASEPAGLVLVLDDLHWATRPTLVLLQHVLHAAPHAKLLILGTYRDTDLDRQHPLSALLADLRRQPGVARVALTGLDLEGVMHLVADAAGHELDESGLDLARLVHRETEGNPFFVGEILRHLRESGAIFVRDGRWVSDVTAAELGIPEGIREVVGRRLDRLTAESNTALTAAAVVGRDFDLSTVSGAIDKHEDDVLSALDEAVRARLVEEIGVGEYRFAHALVRSTLYDELRATRRARMHAKVALILERTRPQDAAVLAHHLVQAGPAGDLDKAIVYCLAAGTEAMQQLAHDRALDYYHQALELIDGEPGHEAQRCAVTNCLGLAQRESGDAAFRETMLAAAASAQSMGLDAELIKAALNNSRGFWSMAGEVDTERIAVVEAALSVVGDEDSPDRAKLLVILASELMFSDETERRQELSEEAVAVARRAGDLESLVDVLLITVPTNYVPWRMDYVLGLAEELLALTDQLGEPVRSTKANIWWFIQSMASGRMAGAEERLDLAVQLAAELGQPSLRWLATSWDSFRVLMKGDLARAEEQINAGFELGQRTGQPDAFTWYAGQLWLLVRERGEVASLLETVEQEVANNPGLPAWEAVLAVIYCVVGREQDAGRILERHLPGDELHIKGDVMWLATTGGFMDTAHQIGHRRIAEILYRALLPYRQLSIHGGITYLGNAERYLAMGARVAERWDDAVAHGEAALKAEERMGSRTWWGVACAELSRTLRTRGSEGDAERAGELEAAAERVAVETGSVFITRRLAGLIG